MEWRDKEELNSRFDDLEQKVGCTQVILIVLLLLTVLSIIFRW